MKTIKHSLLLAFVRRVALLLLLSTLNAQLSTLCAQGTAFTYQGRLNDGPLLANGLYDLTFSVFGVTNGGSAFAGPLTNSAVAVSNGLFTTLLDFGADLFDGPGPVLLEIAVRPTGGGTFSTLNPRQLVTPAPHAISSSFAFQAVSAFNVGDNAAVRSLNSLRDEVTLAAGQNVTITPSGNTLTIASPAGGIGPWQVSGTNTFYNAGNVGIGISAPNAPLHISMPVPVLALQDSGGLGGQVGLVSFRNSAGAETAWLGFGSSGNNTATFMNDRIGGRTSLGAGGVELLTVTPGSGVGIGTTQPQASLDVRGDIRLGASGQFRATSGEENLRIVRGVIGVLGSIIAGSGFTVSRPGTGDYIITFDTPFAGPPAVTATADLNDNIAALVQTAGVTASTANLRVFLRENESPANRPLHFIAIGPR